MPKSKKRKKKTNQMSKYRRVSTLKARLMKEMIVPSGSKIFNFDGLNDKTLRTMDGIKI